MQGLHSNFEIGGSGVGLISDLIFVGGGGEELKTDIFLTKLL